VSDEVANFGLLSQKSPVVLATAPSMVAFVRVRSADVNAMVGRLGLQVSAVALK